MHDVRVAVVRTAEWLIKGSPDEAARKLRAALEGVGLEPEGDGTSFTAQAKRSLLKNRWASQIDVAITPASGDRSLAVVKVDMAGTKHYEMLDELAESMGDAVDDRGLTEAVERLGRFSRVFGRKEVRHARHFLHGDEEVLQLGQGKYGDKMGIIVLTNKRLFFFEKSWAAQTVEEFPLKSISSVSVESKRTGEKLKIHASGNVSEIEQMFHGHGDEVARQIRGLIAERDAPVAAAAPAAQPDAIEQIRRLAELKDAGVLSDEEFAAKKTQLLNQL